MVTTALDYSRTTNRSVDDAAQAVQDAALQRGFRTLHVHDVQKTLEDKGFHIPAYKIVEVCNAGFAHTVISAYKPVGMMLPCRIVVYDDGGTSTVTLMRPTLIAELMPDQDFGEVPATVERTLIEVVDAVAG